MSSTKIKHESFKQSGSSGRRNTSEDYQLQVGGKWFYKNDTCTFT